MSTPIFDPEDPRLTAYALGETLPPADRAEVEILLQQSPEARLAMQEIKDLTADLTAEYDQERQAAAAPAAAELPANVVQLSSASRDSRWSWVRPALAAAAMLLAIALLAYLQPRSRSRQVVIAIPASRGGVSVPPAAAPAQVTEIDPAPTIGEPVQEMILPKEDPQAKLADLKEPAKIELRTQNAKKTEGLSVPGSVGPSVPSQVLTGPVASAKPVANGTGESAVTQSTESQAQRYAGQPTASLRSQFEALPAAPAGQADSGQLQAQTPRFANAKQAAGQAFAARRPVRDYDVNGGLDGRVAKVDTDRDTTYRSATSLPVTKDKEIRREINASPELGIVLRTGPGFNTAAYDHLTENAFLTAKDNPLSTFSADVDTASYANVRRFLESGSLPPPDAVRVEELINYFPYDYAPPTPESGKAFAVHLEAAACPWAPEHRLVRIGIKGREVEQGKRPASNLVFLIDVSGSMEPSERLPLIKRAMSMMVEHLTEQDHVAIVTYAGHSGLALPSTSGEHKDIILGALDRLEAGGGTNGASGIKLAYQVAKDGFIKGGTNRVILATDGDFNVGVTSQGELIRLIQDEAKSGVFLSALGVGTDNYKDSTMQKLADKGNGNYHYIDRLEEARKVLVDQMGGTLVTIAKDVKIQVEFNPAVVAAYRLIGYEKRALRKEDFNDDRIDAGEIGAGHTVTALYEVVPVGQTLPGASPAVDALKYGTPLADTASAKAEDKKEVGADAAKPGAGSGEMLTVKMRHKAPDAEASERSYEEALTDHGTPDDFARASADFKFAAAVADFGLVLRDSPYKGNATLGAAVEWAQEGKGADAKGYRAEFIELVRKARALKEGQPTVDGPVR